MSFKKIISKDGQSNGFFYPIDLEEFEEGKPVEIWTWTYYRYVTFDKNGYIYVLKDNEMDRKFIRKDDWRKRQIDKIIS